MSDRFDAEFKKALKESASKSLEGWEFTPSMRQAVLRRIAEEEATPSAPVPLKSLRQMNTRPYLWMAAAAAAFVVAINLAGNSDRNGHYAAKSDVHSPQTAPATQEVAQAAGAPASQEAARESGSVRSAAAGVAAVPQGAAESAATAAESKPEPAVSATGQAQALADTATAAPPAQNHPARIHLALPEGAPVALKAQPKQEEGAGFAAMVAPVERLSMVRIGANIAVRTQNSVQFLDASGNLIWEQPTGEGAGPLVAWNGNVATTAGSELMIFNAEGRQVRNLTLPGAPEAIALSGDGRVAAIVGSKLVVFEGDRLQFQALNALQTGLAFGPDGSLAAVLEEGGAAYLQLFGRDGSRLTRVKLKGWGLGITFAAGGDVILVGGEAFQRSGQPLWQIPFPTQEVFSLGPDGPVVARDAGQTIALLRPADGTQIWTAQHDGRQTLLTAVSDSGELLAVVASLEKGAAVWVLDQAGGLRYAEQLSAQPSGVSVQGETLYLLMPEGIQTRALPPR